MAERKVIKFLETLSKKELTKFNQYLRSPYFNQSEELCIIYGHLKGYILKKKNEYSFDEVIQNKFSAENKLISKINLDKYLSRIYNFLLDFIAMEQFRNDKFSKNSAQLDYLIENDPVKLFDKIYKKTKTDLDKEKISFQNYLNRFLLERSKTHYLSIYSGNRKDKQNLQETSDALDKFYLTQKYDTVILKLNRERLINEQFEYNFIRELNEVIDEKTLSDDLLLNMLFKFYNNFFIDTKNGEENFEKLCIFFNGRMHKLNNKIAYNFGSLLRNEARRVFDKNDNNYYEYLFKMYKNQISNGVIFYNKSISGNVFKNIIEVAVRSNKLDWCENFIENNHKKIFPKKHAHDITNYAKARLSFFRGNYNITRDFIQTLNFTDIYYKMALRRLEIMVYFELKEYIFLESLINSFRVALTLERCQNLREEHRILNKKFLNYINKLVKIYTSIPPLKKSQLRALSIEMNNINLSNKTWLLKKIKEAI